MNSTLKIKNLTYLIPLNKKSLIIGIGLPTSLAFIFYFLRNTKNKQIQQDDGFNYEDAIKSRQTIIEITVPTDCVRSIIGPQGSVIKEIQRRTNTRINFKDSNTQNGNNEKNAASNGNIDANGTTDRILVIRGSNVNVQRAEFDIKRMILEFPVSLTEEYYVPDYACGRIIGKGGATIREMTNMSNCRIKLLEKSTKQANSLISSTDKSSQQLLSSDSQASLTNYSKKMISISGSFEQIAFAKELIITKIKEEEDFREKRSKKRNKNQFSNSNSRTFSSDSLKKDTYSFEKLESSQDNKTIQLSNSDLNNNDKHKVDLKSAVVNKQISVKVPSLINLQVYLDENDSTEIYVSAICHPLAFWVQICGENTYLLDRLDEDMRYFYNDKSNNIKFDDINEIEIGQLVAAKSSRNRWHRAEVKGVDENEEIDLYFVDFGDSVFLKLNDLRKLANEFYELPYQAVEVCLDGITFIDESQQWSDDSLYYFEEIVYSCKWKTLKLEFVNNKQDIFYENIKKPSVRLYDKSKGSYISDQLIEKGYAKKAVVQDGAELKENATGQNPDANKNKSFD